MTDRTPPFHYAVIDLAVVEDLRAEFTEKRHPAVETLFSPKFAKKLLAVGPWLVRLSDKPDVAKMLDALGPDVPWGYYIYSRVDILSLRQSLRRFNKMQIPDPPREVLFRYWDPRVMGTFLSVATEFQRSRLFETIESFEVAGERFTEAS